jgi:hypothetical protein
MLFSNKSDYFIKIPYKFARWLRWVKVFKQKQHNYATQTKNMGFKKEDASGASRRRHNGR